MKTKTIYKIAGIVLLMCGLQACGKEDIGPQRNYEYGGKATALKNNIEWTAEIRAGKANEDSDGFSFQFLVYNGFTLLEEIYVYNIYPQTGVQDIVTSNFTTEPQIVGSKFYVMIDGDVIDDIYKIDKTKDNYITIDEYDANAAKIRGTFQIHTVIEKDGRFTESEPEVRFTAGEYETEVNPEWFE
ncbi:MAG: hypothetical protein WBB45_08985 [Cyclobacteriaceae bacterium]